MTQEEITAAVSKAAKEAIREELRKNNLIDGPTHIAHHQALAELLSLTKHAKKTLIGSLALGFVTLVLLGLATWRGN